MASASSASVDGLMLSVHDASPSVVAANAKIALWMPPYPEDENYNAAWLVTVELLRVKPIPART